MTKAVEYMLKKTICNRSYIDASHLKIVKKHIQINHNINETMVLLSKSSVVSQFSVFHSCKELSTRFSTFYV